tara:strand:+ start:801 stop:1136 length:336 start_codon:yes stop_codon:yes gene_type:complete
MSPRLSRWHQKILNQLKKLGLAIREIRKSKHIVVTGVLNDNHFRWVTSSTPSTTNAYKKMIADLKRELRRCGVSEIPEFNMKFLSLINEDEDVWILIRQIETELSNASEKS